MIQRKPPVTGHWENEIQAQSKREKLRSKAENSNKKCYKRKPETK